MIKYRRQGTAIVGTLSLLDGRLGNVVLIGARDNPKGATLVLAGKEGGAVQAIALGQGLGLLHPATVVDILCMQERLFGGVGLPRPSELGDAT